MDHVPKPEIQLFHRGWLPHLEELVAAARERLILVAPFVTRPALERIKETLVKSSEKSQPAVTFITNLDENAIQQNFLDLHALIDFAEGLRSIEFYDLRSLHAKIYVADHRMAIVTSANLTSNGLLENIEYGTVFRDPYLVHCIQKDVQAFLLRANIISQQELCDLAHLSYPNTDVAPLSPAADQETEVAEEQIYGEIESIDDSREQDGHILTEEERIYFRAVDKEDWLKVHQIEARRFPRITPEQENELAQQIRQKDEHASKTARELFIQANLRLVIHGALNESNEHLPELDRIQEGYLGLIRAVEKFDPAYGNRFSTYATYWIRQSLDRAHRADSRIIPLPVHIYDSINGYLNKFLQHLASTHRRLSLNEFTEKEELDEKESNRLIYFLTIAMPHLDLGLRLTTSNGASDFYYDNFHEADISPDHVTLLTDLLDPLGRQFIRKEETLQRLLAKTQWPIEHKPLTQEAEFTLGEAIIDECIDLEKDVLIQMMKRDLQSVLQDLPDRQANILRLRFGVFGHETHTLEEIAKQMGVTRERIRQIEKQALHRLAHSSSADSLRDYLHA
ncbi:MAG: sigma-70 family RNA polymerase sigma factor [Chloroflexi bacterium]|nr:sigma-70 family RNA polymerase sigma factor [Chloroflexota bacterium]